MSASLLRHRAVPQASTTTLSSPTTLQFASAPAYDGPPSSSSKSSGRYNSVFGQQQRSSSWLRRGSSFDESPFSGGWKKKLVLAAGFLLLTVPCIRYNSIYWKFSTLQGELTLLHKDQRRLQSRLRAQTDTLTRVKADTDQQKKKNDVLLGELKKHGDSFEAFDSEHYAEAEAVENAYFKRVEELETEIQRSSERKLATKGYGIFGSTKAIRVEITLTADVSTFGNKLVMELGSVSSLAHAIELFLMLVEKKHFYDHLTLMHRSAGSSVINTIPMDSETLQIVSNNFVRGGSPVIGSVTNSEPIDVKKQDEIMLLQLAMLEQSVDYPIQKYSGEFSSFP